LLGSRFLYELFDDHILLNWINKPKVFLLSFGLASLVIGYAISFVYISE
ncbi:hypothetical protein LCGC14_2557250, partial [marine sediment metagenome]